MPELTPHEWAEVEELFERALELSAGARTDFLQRECSHESVRQEVESLLAHASAQNADDRLLSAASAIASAAGAVADEADPDERLIGARLGPYRVISIAGHGGMGAVYRAERDDDEFQQMVAIKLVRAAAESRATQQRFRQERQILARLSHPNIACLLDGGSTAEGIPYLVMEFIEGIPITAWCDRESLSVEQRVRIFLPVCDAVESANRDNVIHRDLKPANIQVNLEGVPKLLDFGIAKLVDPDDADPTLETRLPAMTPEYASPEQVNGGRVSAASDVYSLGLVLYEVLTGQKAQKVPDRTPQTLIRVICHEEPVRPSALKPQLSRDLDHIIRRAIRKEPERRYQTAAELGNDLRKYLEGRPVTARADTFAYRTGRFFSRNRHSAAVGMVTAAIVFIGVSAAYWLSRPSRAPRVLQVVQITHSGHVSVDDPIVTDGASVYFSDQVGGHVTLARVPVDGGSSTPLTLTPALPNPSILNISPDRSRLLITSSPTQTVSERSPIWTVSKAGGRLALVKDLHTSSAAWSRDGRTIFFIDGRGLFRINSDGTDRRKLFDVPIGSGALRQSPAEPGVLRLSLFARNMRSSDLWQLSPDGTGAHPLLSGAEFALGSPDVYYGGDWNASGSYYLFRVRRNSITSFWALHEGHEWLSPRDRRPVEIYTTPLKNRWLLPSLDGKRVFFTGGQEQHEFVRYNRRRGEFLPFLSGVSGAQVSLSKDQSKVAYTLSPQNTLWTSRVDGSDRVQLTKPPMRVFDSRWSPDGKSIAFTGSEDGQPTRVYLLPENGGAPKLFGTAPFEQLGGWSSDGRTLLIVRTPPPGFVGQRGIFLVDLKTDAMEHVPGSEPFLRCAWSFDGRYIAGTKSGNGIDLFDFHTRRWSGLTRGGIVADMFWSRDGKYVYFQDLQSGNKMPISRLRISDGKVERLMDWDQIPQANVSSYRLQGLTSDDEPIASVTRNNSDLFALDVDLP